jgi:hypothetical protein
LRKRKISSYFFEVKPYSLLIPVQGPLLVFSPERGVSAGGEHHTFLSGAYHTIFGAIMVASVRFVDHLCSRYFIILIPLKISGC